MLGNGSDEIITLLALATAQPDAAGRAKMLAPMPGFVMYPLSAKLQGLDFVGVPLTPDFALDEAAMLAAVEMHRPALTFLAYPNNPTATLWDEAVVQRIIDMSVPKAASSPSTRPTSRLPAAAGSTVSAPSRSATAMCCSCAPSASSAWPGCAWAT